MEKTNRQPNFNDLVKDQKAEVLDLTNYVYTTPNATWKSAFKGADLVLIHDSDKMLNNANVLDKACDNAPSGCLIVIYSDGGGFETFQEYKYNGRIIWKCSHALIERNAPALVANWLKENQWQKNLLASNRMAILSTAIHDLYNLPVNLDADTSAAIVKETNKDQSEFLKDYSDMWNATFGDQHGSSIIEQVEKIASRTDEAGCCVKSLPNWNKHVKGFDKLVRDIIKDFNESIACLSSDITKPNILEYLEYKVKTDKLKTIKCNLFKKGQEVPFRIVLACALQMIAKAVRDDLINPLKTAREERLRKQSKGKAP